EFNKFDASFKSYYQSAVTPWMKIKDEVEAAANKTKGTGTEPPSPGGPPPGKVELGAEPAPPPTGPSSPGPSSPVGTPLTGVPPMGGGFVTFKPNVPAPAPAQQTAPPPASDEAPDTLPGGYAPGTQVRVAPEPDKKIRVQTHEKFYQSLESMGQEDPRILCSYIAKYATSIQGDDPETAIALFSIVKRLKG